MQETASTLSTVIPHRESIFSFLKLGFIDSHFDLLDHTKFGEHTEFGLGSNTWSSCIYVQSIRQLG